MQATMPKVISKSVANGTTNDELAWDGAGGKILYRVDFICVDYAKELSTILYVDGNSVLDLLVLPDDCVVVVLFPRGLEIQDTLKFYNTNSGAAAHKFQAVVYTQKGVKIE
jgi:hypothetical protein